MVWYLHHSRTNNDIFPHVRLREWPTSRVEKEPVYLTRRRRAPLRPVVILSSSTLRMPPKGKKGAKSKAGEEEALTRIAIVTAEKCKPKKCNQECKKSCPVVKLGKLCIEVTPKSKLAFISEPLCIGECQIGSSVSVPSRQPHPKDVSFSHPDTPFFSSHQAVVFVSRNVLSKPLISSTCPRILRRTPRIVTDPTRSSCTVCPCPDPAKSWASWAPMVLVNRPRSRFSLVK